MTAGAVALLSVPVVALAKGPPDGTGQGTGTAGTVVPPQANVPDAPPGHANKPEPAPKPPPQAPAETSAPGPPAQVPPAWAPGSARAKGNTPGRRGPKPAPPPPEPSQQPAAPADNPTGSEQGGGGSEPGNGVEEPSRSPSPDKPDPTGALELPSADSPDTGDGGIAGALVGDTVELPEDASPETLPFTGLQLALMVLAGLAVMAGGLALRRTVTR